MNGNNKNTFLAIALSILVIVAWQFLYINPKLEAERLAQEAEEARQAQQSTQIDGSTSGENTTSSDSANLPSTGNSNVPQPGATPSQDAIPGSAVLARDAALARSERIVLDTPRLEGSINLRGARIDDLRLKDYHETVDETSPTIILFSPSDVEDAYFAEFGYVAGEAEDAPGPNTVWNQQGRGQLGVGSPVTLSWTNAKGVTFNRTIAIDDDYLFTVSDEIVNSGSDAAVVSPYGRIARFGDPEIEGIFVLHEGLLGVFGEDNLREVDYDELQEDGQINIPQTDNGWLGITDKYWAATLLPSGSFKPRFSYFTDGRARYQTDFLGDASTIAPGASQSFEQRLFAGAKEVQVIDAYDDQYGLQNFDLLIDWGWFYFITKPMFWVLDYLFNLVGNFGVAILITTVIVKLIFLPLANLSYASMAKMKKLQPEMLSIRERLGDDRVAQQQAMMELYKKEKINPAAGCWPILIQIPVFFAIYKVLYVTIEMRHAPFFGWIQDLAAPDPTSMFNLFGLLPFEVPAFLMIGVWPLIMGITMFLQMRMNPAPPDPTQAMIFNWMPVVFTFMLATFPAGLVIYWAWNNFLSIVQQGFIMKRHGVKIELWDNLIGMFNKKKSEPEDKSADKPADKKDKPAE